MLTNAYKHIAAALVEVFHQGTTADKLAFVLNQQIELALPAAGSPVCSGPLPLTFIAS